MSDNPAEQFVNDEFPSHFRPLLPSAIRRAYHAADLTIERHAYLRTPGGRYERGDLIMVAASYELEQLLLSGSLPFDGAWEFHAKPTGKHFVLHTTRARITTNQVSDPAKKPRRAEHRENYAEHNCDLLFPEMKPAIDPLQKLLLHLLHGYQNLNFIHLAYPDPEENKHIFRSENLMRLPHEVELSPDLPPQEGPTESPDPEIIENIERHLRDNE